VHLDLYRAYIVEPSATTLEPLLQWDYRIRSRDLTTYRAPYETSTWATDRKAVAALHGLADLTAGTGVWEDTPTTEAEILTALASAVENNALIPFPTVGFSQDLVPVSGLTSSTPKPTHFQYQSVSGTWWVHGTGTLTITAAGGRAGQDQGPDHFRLYDWASGEVLLDTDVPEDRVSRDYPVTLQSDHLYRLEVTCAGGVKFSWTPGFGFTLLSSELVGYFTGAGASSVVFYVPKGTQSVGFYAQAGTIKLYDATGAQVGDTVVAHHDYYSVAVPQGQDGSVWEITGVNGAWGLLTVPPGFALAADELLVPREVAEQDGLAVVP
jgi:hypothetical protein